MDLIKLSVNAKQTKLKQLLFSALFVIAISYASEEFIPGRLNTQKGLLVLIALAGTLIFSCKNGMSIKVKYWRPLALFPVPFILSMLYTIIVCNINGDNLGVVRQATTTTMFLLVIFFAVMAIAHFFGKSTVKIMAACLIGAYSYAVMHTILNIGVADSIKELLAGEIERNDIGVAVVPLLLYYFYILLIENRKLNSNGLIVGLLLLVMFFCGKRSAFLSLGVGTILIVLVKCLGRKSVLLMKLTTLIAILTCLIYIICIHSGELNQIFAGKGTLSDRLYVWKWFDSMYEISPRYIGKGFGFIHRYMAAGLGDTMVNEYGYLHNSILQIYIETGYFGFFLWIGIYLLEIPHLAMKKIGENAYVFTAISLLAMFAMFTVDNVLTYPLYQMCLYCSLYSVYRYEKIKFVGMRH